MANSSNPKGKEPLYVDGINIRDPTATAIAAASGMWKDREEEATLMYNFMDVTESDHEEASNSLQQRLKQHLLAMTGASRGVKITEQVLTAEKCSFKEVSELEELMATTFEPLRDQGKKLEGEGVTDKTLEKQRKKFNYMVVDNLRVAVSSLLHAGDVRECVLYLCDRRIEDPILGALALITFPLSGMQTHVYKTGRIMAFSKHETLAPQHLQLYFYAKGAKLIKKDNMPLAVNVRATFVFSNNAENALKHPTMMDTEGNLVSFMTENSDLFAWMNCEPGKGFSKHRRTYNVGNHSMRKSVLDRWSRPTGNVSRRMTDHVPIQEDEGDDIEVESSQNDQGAGAAYESGPLHRTFSGRDIVRGRVNPYAQANLSVGRARSSLITTTPDLSAHNVTEFVQDAEIPTVQASLESFMDTASVKQSISLYTEQFKRPVFVDAIPWRSTAKQGAEIFSLELPGDLMAEGSSSMYSDIVQRAFCFKNDFSLNILMAGNESFTGAIQLCWDPLRRLHEAGKDDDLVYHSMPGPILLAQDTNGITFDISFSSIHEMISAHDKTSHNTIGRVSFRVIAPLTHVALSAPTLVLTLQVYVKNLNVKHPLWRSMETAFPVSMGAHLPSIVGDVYGRKEDASTEIFSAQNLASIITQRGYLGSATITSETAIRTQLVKFAVHPMSSRCENGVLTLTQLAAVSAMFAFWRGSLRLTMEISCSSSTRGKLLLSVVPKGGVPIVGVEAAYQGMGAEFDLGTSTKRMFEVPYVSTDKWESLGNDGLMSIFEGVWDCPVAHLIVIQPIVSVGATTPAVSVRFYLEPGADFQLRGRRHINLRSSIRLGSLGTGQGESILGGTEFCLMSKVDFDATQEKVVIQIPCAPWYSKETIDYTLLQNPLHWSSRFFTFWKGSIEFRIVIKDGTAGEEWQAPITIWHNPSASMETCKVFAVKGKSVNKEGYHGKKFSLMQTKSVDIVAHDDQRFSWRLCKLMDTTVKDALKGVTATKVEYTGHPPLSSHNGCVFVKIPKGSLSGTARIYSKAGSDFRFLGMGGVPSLKLNAMREYAKPVQLYTNKETKISPVEDSQSAGRDLGVGRARGFFSIGSRITAPLLNSIKSSEPCYADNNDVFYPASETPSKGEEEQDGNSLLDKAKEFLKRGKEKFSELVGKIFSFLSETLYSSLREIAKSFVGTVLGGLLDKIRATLSNFFEQLSDQLGACLMDPQCLCIIGLAITAICGYSTLKLCQAIIPNALGIFGTVFSLACATLSALYWPQAAINIMSAFHSGRQALEEVCEMMYCFFFQRESFFTRDGPFGALYATYDKEDESCANSVKSSAASDDFEVGKSRGAREVLSPIVGMLAYFKILMWFYKALDPNIKDPFTISSIEKHCRQVSGIATGIKTLRDFKDYIYRAAVGAFMPTSSYITLSHQVGFDIREWFQEVEALTLQDTRYDNLSDPEKIRTIRLAYDKGVAVMSILAQIDSPHLARICDKTHKLARDLLEETHRVKGISDVRLDPYHVSLYGEPGVGKSFIMGKLINDLLDMMGEPIADRCYSRSPNEQFWSGYIGQTAVKCDDLGQDLTKGYCPSYSQVIDMKTNNCMVVPMADLANKGRTFSSKYIFSTTNVPDCGTKHGLAEPEAFMRRRDLLVKVEQEGDRVDGGVFHLRFTILNPLEPETHDARYPEKMTYTDFLCVCAFECRVYMARQEKVLETLRGKTTMQDPHLSEEVEEMLYVLDPIIARDIFDVEFMKRVQKFQVSEVPMAGASMEEDLDTVSLNSVEKEAEESVIQTMNKRLMKELLERKNSSETEALERGEAKGNSYSSYQEDAYGRPLASPFVPIFSPHRDQYRKDRKINLSDQELHDFGVHMTMGNFAALYTGKLGLKCCPVPERRLVDFFRYFYEEKLCFLDESSVLCKLPVTTASTVHRLIGVALIDDTDEWDVKPVFQSEVDQEMYDSLSLVEQTAFSLCVVARRVKKKRCWNIRGKLAQWFSGVNALCSEILDSLPSMVKIILVAATSFGSLYLAFKGATAILSGIQSVHGMITRGSWVPEDKGLSENVTISLDGLLACGGSSGRGVSKRRRKPYTSSGDEVTERHERMMIKAQLATGRARGGMTASDTVDHIKVRMGKITNVATGANMVATNIGGGYILAPLHIFDQALDGDMLEFKWDGVSYYFVFSKCDVHQLESFDACLIDSHKAVPSRVLNTSIFMDEDMLESYTDMACDYVVGPFDDARATRIESDLVARREKSFRYVVNQVTVMAIHGWSVAIPAENGQCGSLLVSKDSKVNGKVFGLLVAENMSKSLGTAVSTFVPITKQAVLRALGAASHADLRDGQAKAGICGVPITPDMRDSLKLGDLFTEKEERGLFPHGRRLGSIQVMGSTTKEGSLLTTEKTTIKPSLLQPFLPRAPETEPSIMSRNDPRIPEGVRFDPMIDGVRKYEVQATPFTAGWRKSILEAMVSDMEDWERHLVRENFQESMGEDHIINGIDGMEYYEGLNMSTSEGYPLITKRPKEASSKKYLFHEDENSGKLVMKDAWMIANYASYGEALRSNAEFPLICIECPKDERRPLSKIYDKPKTRLFSILPVEFNMHARRLFLDFNVFTMSNRHHHGIMVGINPHSREWTDLALSLASFSPFGFNGDFANFDGMFHSDAFAMVAELANVFYDNHENNERLALTSALTNRLSIVRGNVMHIPGGGPSGFPMTVIFNSYINLFYLQSAWCYLATESGHGDISNPVFYKKYVKAYVYGDDNLVAIKEEVIEWYNLCTVSKFLKDFFGVTLTDGDKNEAAKAKPYGNILEFDFLKRGFVPDEGVPSLFHAPLAKRSIEEQVYWIREGGDDWDLLLANIENALYEAYHHGRAYFDGFRSDIKGALGKIGRQDTILPSYLMCKQRWFSQDLGEGANVLTSEKLGKFVAATKLRVDTEERGRQEEINNKLLEVKFESVTNANGVEVLKGPLQRVMRGVYIGPHVSIKQEGAQMFSLIINNTLSLAQEKYGQLHGLCSLKHPNFHFLERAGVLLKSNWPCRVLCVDQEGSPLAYATVVILLHFCKVITTNALCVNVRKHIGSKPQDVLAQYFYYLNTAYGRETQRKIEAIGAGSLMVDSTCAKLMAFDKGRIQGDSLELPIRIGNKVISMEDIPSDSDSWEELYSDETDDDVEIA